MKTRFLLIIWSICCIYLLFLSLEQNNLYDHRNDIVPQTNNEGVTITFMTCNRFKLLKRTIESFEKHNTYYDINSRVIMIDCYDRAFHEMVSETFPNYTVLISRALDKSGEKRMLNNLDHLFEYVSTKYWFHIEDDWEFIEDSPLEAAIQVLKTNKENENFIQVILRDPKNVKPKVDTKFGWKPTGFKELKYTILRKNAGPAGLYGSFSANPFLMETCNKMKFIGMFYDYSSEADVSKQLSVRYNMSVAITSNGFYVHIGDEESKIHKKNLLEWERGNEKLFNETATECNNGLKEIGVNIRHGCCQKNIHNIPNYLRSQKRHMSSTPATFFVKRKLKYKTILFAGDSLTQNMVNSLVQQVQQEGELKVARGVTKYFNMDWHGNFQEISSCSLDWGVKNNTSTCGNGKCICTCNLVNSWVIETTNTTILYYNFYTYYDHEAYVGNWLERDNLHFNYGSRKLLEYIMKQVDHSVVNIGLHEEHVLGSEFRLKIENIAKILEQHGKHKKSTNFYRLTLPQHFDNGNYMIGHGWQRGVVPRHWTDELASKVLMSVVSPHVKILDLYDLFKDAWFMHGLDMSHWCYSPYLWGPVWDLFSVSLM